MKNNKKKENLKLIIEISDESSELIQRLEKYIENDYPTQKLPNDFSNLDNQSESD